MQNYQAKIKGTGRFLPGKIVTNEDLSKIVETNDQWITERTGIKERRISDPTKNEFPSDMAAFAAKEAIKKAHLEPNDIDFVLFSVTKPDMFFPNSSSILQEKVGITNMCGCLDINAACSGWVCGLTLANSLIQNGTYKNILLVGTEMTSSFNNWKDGNTCILFGDGAGAAIIGRADENENSQFFKTILGSDSSKKDHLKLEFGGARQPITKQHLEEGTELAVSMNGQEVFKAAVKTMASHCQKVIADSGYTPQDIAWFIPHQANMRIIEAAANRLEFPMSKVISNVDKYANTSSASIPIALDEAIEMNKIKRGDLILFAAFGAGLTSGAALIRY